MLFRSAEDIVYPIQKPLNANIKYTIGIPINVEPTNHNVIVNKKLEINELLNNSVLLISELSFNFPTNSFIYVPISSICSPCCFIYKHDTTY